MTRPDWRPVQWPKGKSAYHPAQFPLLPMIDCDTGEVGNTILAKDGTVHLTLVLSRSTTGDDR